MTTQHSTGAFGQRAEFRSPNLEAKLKPWYEEALAQFEHLPYLRLLCYFDSENPEWLQRLYGDYAAIHTPIIGGGPWPQYVERYFLDRHGDFAFDNLIYVPRTAFAQQKVSFEIALAHELQHFMQWGKVLEANNLLYQNLASFDPLTQIKPWGLPHNRDALIVAIGVAKAVCGPEAVREFIDTQVADGREKGNISKQQMWTWASRILLSPAPYDMRADTDRLVQRYKANLMEIKSDIDFSVSDRWEPTPKKGS